VGLVVGAVVGVSVGTAVKVSTASGVSVGALVGVSVGASVGALVTSPVGAAEGAVVGSISAFGLVSMFPGPESGELLVVGSLVPAGEITVGSVVMKISRAFSSALRPLPSSPVAESPVV
jgi:hypothetical protein